MEEGTYIGDGDGGLKGLLADILDHVLDQHATLSDVAHYPPSQCEAQAPYAPPRCVVRRKAAGYLQTSWCTPSLETRVIFCPSVAADMSDSWMV